MTVTQMTYFMALCDCLSFSKAAEQLNVTQPAISSAIRELEKECNVRLFERKKNTLALTAEGQVLAQLVEPCLKQVQELNAAVKHLDQVNQHLRVGFTTLFGNYVYSDILSRFMRTYPHVQISAQESTSHGLWQMLDTNQLDIILVVVKNRVLPPELYSQMSVVNTALRFCVSTAHPLAWNRQISWSEIAQLTVVP